ncbi:GntT/GntP/DsdX family permease [Staphylococcus aureus]
MHCSFEVGLVLLIPLVFTVAKRANVSVLKLGLPMVTALSVTHGFLPPHPGPVIAKELKANVGDVLLYGYHCHSSYTHCRAYI